MIQKDYIYESLLDNSSISNLKLDNILIPDDYSLLPYPELIKQRLLRSKYKSLDKLAYPQDVLMLLLLHRDFITTDQLRMTNLFSNDSSAISVKLSKLQKGDKKNQAIIKSQFIDKNKDNTKVYYLTPYGRQKLQDYLPETYLKNNFIEINHTPAFGNIVHDAELLNLFYYLISDEHFIDFQWISDIPLVKRNDLDSSLSSLEQNIIDDLTGAVKPDAILIPWNEPNNSIIFVEQDMRTERLNQIIDKLMRYDIFLEHHDENSLAMEIILFSTKTDSGDEKIAAGEDTNRSSKLNKVLSDLKRYMQSTQTESVKEAYKSLNTIIKNARDDKKLKPNTLQYYLQLHKFIKTAIEFDPSINSLDGIGIYINNLKHSYDVQEAAENIKYGTKQLSRRIATYRSAIEKAGDIKNKLLHGLSIIGCDSRNLEYLPFLLIDKYHTYDKLLTIFKRKYMKANPKYTYTNHSYIKVDNKQFLFKHALHVSSLSVPLFIENISHDIGGEFRVRNFLENGIKDNMFVFLCLLVKNVEDAVEFSTSYSLCEKYRNEDNLKMTKGDIHIVFISYESQDSTDDIFIIDNNGNPYYFDDTK